MKIPMPEISLEEQLKKMQRDWDERARENARYYVATGKNDWTDEEFFQSGERTVAEEAARRIPVKLLFPLVGCTLPAFALLTVAPLVAGALRSLRL